MREYSRWARGRVSTGVGSFMPFACGPHLAAASGLLALANVRDLAGLQEILEYLSPEALSGLGMDELAPELGPAGSPGTYFAAAHVGRLSLPPGGDDAGPGSLAAAQLGHHSAPPLAERGLRRSVTSLRVRDPVMAGGGAVQLGRQQGEGLAAGDLESGNRTGKSIGLCCSRQVLELLQGAERTACPTRSQAPLHSSTCSLQGPPPLRRWRGRWGCSVVSPSPRSITARPQQTRRRVPCHGCSSPRCSGERYYSQVSGLLPLSCYSFSLCCCCCRHGPLLTFAGPGPAAGAC